MSRFDLATGDVQEVAPSAPQGTTWRFVRTEPLLFSPVDPRILYYAGNVVFKTLNGGSTWQVISPDLTRARYDMPASVGAFASQDPEKGAHRGVVYTIAPSFRRVNLLWVGTDDGLIWVTHNGGVKWTDEWDCTCNDRCPKCSVEIEPYDGHVTLYMADRYHDDVIAFEPRYAVRKPDGGWGEFVADLELLQVQPDRVNQWG